MRSTQVISTALVAGLFWFACGEGAKAGPIDQIGNWILGALLALGAGAVGVGGHQVVKRSKSPDVHSVWYATNRTFDHDEYTSELSDTLRYGVCKVAIPEGHEVGSTGSSKIKRFWQRVATGADDALDVLGDRAYSESFFFTLMGQELSRSDSQILLYIHGFNVSFHDAILRAGQIGFDLKVTGVTTAFCWASRADPTAYIADEDTIKLSERHLAEYLSALRTKFPNHTINILAHSMGNRALLGVLADLQKYPALIGARFGQIFLAAPDIDVRYFKPLSHVYPVTSLRTTLYVCSKDTALLASESLSGEFMADYRVF